MTRQLLNEIIKSKKLENIIDACDKVCAWINDNYTFITVQVGAHECVPGGVAKMIVMKTVRLSVASILKKGEHWPDEYETSPFGEYIWNLK